MKTQIPIYRAKKVDSDEFVEGVYMPLCPDTEEIEHIIYSRNLTREHEIMHTVGYEANEVDPSTLAIHFPNMIDSEDNKIFASLSKDGYGGDILIDIASLENEMVLIFMDYAITFKEQYGARDFIQLLHRSRLKVTGIQK